MRAPTRRSFAYLAGPCLVLASLLYAAAPAQAQVGGGNGLIIFDYWPSGNGGTEIWSLNPTTRATANLSKTNFGDDQPAVSPSGAKIAFRHNNAIWVMNINGTGRKNLTPSVDTAANPSWSPNGKQIVFSDNDQLSVMSSTGTGRKLITTGTDDLEPSWSPDGTSIAFSSYRNGESEQIYTVNPDGSNAFCVSGHSGYGENSPDWSPDSSHIVFNSDRSLDGDRENFTVARNGTGVTQVTAAAPSGTHDPAYAPDGVTLAYTGNADGGIEVYTENIAAGPASAVQLTQLAGTSLENLSWQPVPTTSASASPSSVARGGNVTVSVSGLGDGETATVSLADSAHKKTSLGTLVAGSTGSGSAVVKVPATAARGTATFTVTGKVTGRKATTTITVT